MQFERARYRAGGPALQIVFRSTKMSVVRTDMQRVAQPFLPEVDWVQPMVEESSDTEPDRRSATGREQNSGSGEKLLSGV